MTKLIKSIEELVQYSQKNELGILIGNFDGVHIGHKGLIEKVLEQCSKRELELVVMTFNPHPLIVLKNKQQFLINTYEERFELLSQFGIEGIVEYNFTRDFSTLSPSEFLDQYVLVHSNVKALFLGYDFAFGANKEGDHSFVVNYCKDKNVEVVIQEEIEDKNVEVSSSSIREALLEGNIELANELLGRDFFIRGRVIKGAGRGKQIGFPTANLELKPYSIVPQDGVYASKVFYKGGYYQSITNIGRNPTFEEEHHLNVETYIFDFDQDIYGEEIQVCFEKKIRDEKKFPSVNHLIEQIKEDCKKRKELS